MIAVGVPGWPPPSTDWDWWPFVGIVLVCLICVRIFGIRARMPLLAAAVALGPVFATMVHHWGVLTSLGWIVASTAVVAVIAHWVRSERHPPTV